MRRIATALITATAATMAMLGNAEARGFGDNDTAKYFGSGEQAVAGMQMEMEMTKGTAQMPVGTGEHWVAWLEFTTADIDATSAFMSTVFGWQVMPFMDGYSIWMPDMEKGVLGCGLSQNPEMPQQTAYYLYNPDIDAKLAEVDAMGGSTFMEKMPIAPDMPNIAMFMDASGVIVGLIDQALPAEDVANPVGPGASGVPGQFCGLEIYSGDSAMTTKFYGKLFGWGVKPGMDGYLEFHPGSGISGVFQNHTPDAKVMAYIWSDDVQATLDAVTAAGGTTFGDAMGMEDIATFGYFVAPGGLMLGIMGPAS
ncbi:MAG: hypothetical protein H7A35_02515 [Planctomycetales bacterium]|nr:hypothetical protein [bacterium]UNM08932.1 MAG: hypothetical protein H7A35_02515 [Planctomycetales bacterium]